MAHTNIPKCSHRPSTSTLRRWQIDRFAGAFQLFAGALIGLSAPLQTFAFDNLGANQEFGSSTLQLLESRASSIREMNMTSSIASREGQPVVAINPTNPDNIVFVSTRFHPLPELEPVGGCFLTYTLDRGITWNNVTANYPLGTAPKCGEP